MSGREIFARRPVSRVLSRPRAAGDDHSSGTSVAGRLARPTRATARKPARRRPLGPARLSPLCGLAPGGVCPAAAVTGGAVRSYRTLSPLPRNRGGLLSVALSLGLPPPDVIRRRVSMEPGLSSARAQRPSGRLAMPRYGHLGQASTGLPLTIPGEASHCRRPRGAASCG